MAAGKIVLKPHALSSFVARDTIIMGNTCLYGATRRNSMPRARPENACGRNSGALGRGERGRSLLRVHDRRRGVRAGRTGVNFGAGFTGGFAYVLDLERDFVDRYNHD